MLTDNINQLNNIKKYFNQNDVPNPLSETLIFELSKNLINKIIVNPISKESAEIVFVPKFGDELSATVNRQNSDMSIGNITKKILPILTLRLKRFSVPHFSKKEYKDIEYHLKLQI